MAGRDEYGVSVGAVEDSSAMAEKLKGWLARGWVLGLLAGALGWGVMSLVGHLWQDHLLVHALAQIEMSRQQQVQSAPPPPPPASPPKE